MSYYSDFVMPEVIQGHPARTRHIPGIWGTPGLYLKKVRGPHVSGNRIEVTIIEGIRCKHSTISLDPICFSRVSVSDKYFLMNMKKLIYVLFNLGLLATKKTSG